MVCQLFLEKLYFCTNDTVYKLETEMVLKTVLDPHIYICILLKAEFKQF